MTGCYLFFKVILTVVKKKSCKNAVGLKERLQVKKIKCDMLIQASVYKKPYHVELIPKEKIIFIVCFKNPFASGT
jgi:hypothetical protein